MTLISNRGLFDKIRPHPKVEHLQQDCSSQSNPTYKHGYHRFNGL